MDLILAGSVVLLVAFGGAFLLTYQRHALLGFLLGVLVILASGGAATYFSLPTPEECAAAGGMACELGNAGLLVFGGLTVVATISFMIYAMVLNIVKENAFPMSFFDGRKAATWRYAAYLIVAVMFGVVVEKLATALLRINPDLLCLSPVVGFLIGMYFASRRDRLLAKTRLSNATAGPTNACS